jgi:SAM-dependent methyltransferase
MEYMDILSRLGVASAHPGGFKATQRLLDRELPDGGLNVLEVGCGTGKTACYLAEKGFRVTALDRHPLMLEKARRRAEQSGVTNVDWVLGDVEALPFDPETFDIVYAESVTVFTHIPKALAEYHRVLKPNGRLLDRELVLHERLPEPIQHEIQSFFRMDRMLTLDEWMALLHQAGFRCNRPNPESFWSHEPDAGNNDIQELDISALLDPEIGAGILRYADLMLAQEQYFRACDFVAIKSN